MYAGLAVLLLLGQAAGAAAVATSPAPRTAVARALPSLEQSAKRFVASRSCVSCHHNILPIMTLRLAASRGFRIDQGILSNIERKTFRELTAARAFDDAIQGSGGGDPALNGSWLLLAAQAAHLPPNVTSAVYAKRIASLQRDGYWTTSDFRPPHSSSLFTVTATAIRAVDAYLPDEMRDTRERVRRDARQWLLSRKPESTEDATFRLVGLVWAGASRADVTSAIHDLTALQRPGGGWAQLAGYAQDAYSTGEALYALHEAGVPTSDPSRRKGAAFLVRTQAADGTWRVRTRMISPAEVSPPYFTTGFPYKKDEYISYAATSWATLALLNTLPELSVQPRGMPPPPAIEPTPLDGSGAMRNVLWTALFGTAAQLQGSAAAELNRNWTTPNGTSLLMAAAPDAAKVRELLAHGADAAFRAPSGYDAVTVATSYGGAAAAVAALVDAGAETDPPDGVKVSPPLLFASMSGDVDTVSVLLSRGAKANPRPSPSGDSPIAQAITFGHAAIVRSLVAAGAKVDLVERTGVNLLHWATITNRADVVSELAKAGVDVNAIDEAGFTPLMYAATIDFGDTATLRALLAAGADRRIKNDSGRTALQQARLLGHAKLADALR